MSSFNAKNDITWRDFLIRLALIICTVTIIVWLMPRNNYATFKIEQGKPWAYTDLHQNVTSILLFGGQSPRLSVVGREAISGWVSVQTDPNCLMMCRTSL